MDRKLREWRAAKARKDFVTADALREELREHGHDPDKPPRAYADDERLLRWREAKAARDFDTADAIRSELRAEGIDPDKQGGGLSSSIHTALVDAKVKKWREAKQERDYDTADALRQELRDKGIDIDAPGGRGTPFEPALPPAAEGKFSGARSFGRSTPYNSQIESQLDQWQHAKALKDWETADSIRASLRKIGVEPGEARPHIWTDEEETHQWQLAKKAGDYGRADRLRDDLRSRGVDPDPRGAGNVASVPVAEGRRAASIGGRATLDGSAGVRAGTAVDRKGCGTRTTSRGKVSTREVMVSKRNDGVDDELRRWHIAKDEKNWAVADSIRARLREQGIEPANLPRPSSRGGLANLPRPRSRGAPY
eukprot:TRINITY_DN42076_c0_g1_i1.p1 TRINITY_DN42076_c0_g1~~TRINITY_DN42076_c0_g1_i1.p1  ORF type:complete len:367 (-),score=76.21 TRINITY_DN42076_c0_g1_i1:73-1173(-)